MKRLARRIVVIFLCLTFIGFLTPALTEETQVVSISEGLNVVILLDSSTSMGREGESTGADPERFRLEAASIMVGMCSVGDSNVAVIPFDRYPHEDSVWGKMHPVTEDTRKTLTEAILGYTRTSGGTYIYRALEKANGLLEQLQSEGSPNKNIVLLLCDGQQSPVSDDRSSITLAQMEELLTEQVERAAGNGSVIYSIGLAGAADATYDAARLSSMATATGGIMREARSASSLPKIFSELFAHAIGSDMVADVQSGPVDGLESMQQIFIPIPNNSVREANILIPAEYVREGSMIIVLDESGRGVLNGKGMYTLYYDNNLRGRYNVRSRFYQVKITNPPAGDWKIQFERSSATPSALHFDLLYNYNVQLYAQLPATELLKDETLSVRAYFLEQYNAQTGQGTPSGDIALYQRGIQATLQVVDMYNNVLGEFPMNRTDRALNAGEPAGCFYIDIPLAQAGVLRQGDYKINVVAEGDHLVRGLVNDVMFHVTNRTPEATNVAHTIQIEDILSQTMDESQTWTIGAGDLFVDLDGDALEYALPAEGDVVSLAAADGKFTFTTKGKVGTQSLVISATDNDFASCEATVEITVESIAQQFLADHEARLALGKEPGQYDKGETAQIYLQLYRTADDSLITDQRYYDLLNAELLVHRESEPKDIAQYSMRLESLMPAGRTTPSPVMVMPYTLAVLAENYRFDADVTIQDLSMQVADVSLLLNPVPPVLVQDAIDRIVKNHKADGPEGKVPFLLDLDECFTDTPGDTLRYACEIINDPVERGIVAHLLSIIGQIELSPDTVVEKAEQGNILTFTPVSDGKVSVVLTATDNDGLSVKAQFDIIVESPAMQTMILLATVVILVCVALILWLLAYWLVYRKKWLSIRHNSIDFFIDGSQVVTEAGVPEATLPTAKGKKELKLSSLTDNIYAPRRNEIDGELANKLNRIFVRPASRNNLRVRIKDKRFFKGESSCEVSIEGVKALSEKRHSMMWDSESRLSVSVGGHTVGIQRIIAETASDPHRSDGDTF